MSEVAALRKKIEEEWIAANRALYGFATVAKHEIITHRFEKIQEHTERLGELVGQDMASQIMMDVMRERPELEPQPLMEGKMQEKIKLQKIRNIYHFDLSTLAQVSGVSPATVYYALTRQPIKRQEAERILEGLSKITGIAWDFNTVDLIVWEDSLILYLAYAHTRDRISGKTTSSNLSTLAMRAMPVNSSSPGPGPRSTLHSPPIQTGLSWAILRYQGTGKGQPCEQSSSPRVGARPTPTPFVLSS